MRNIILFGPQGSGKGTQANLLAWEFSIPHISTGDILREAILNGTELGIKAKSIIDAGELVPDHIVNGIIKERLQDKDCNNGFILDGYPRNIEQAKTLDEFSEINFVIELNIPDNLSVKRIVHRRQCRKCGFIYGLDFPPKREGVCDKCGGKLYQRNDDKEEAIKERLKIYHEETEPILEYYKPKNIVYHIDGSLKVEKIKQKLINILG